MSRHDNKSAPLAAVPPLVVHEIDYLLLCALRAPQVFSVAKSHIKPEHFDINSEPHKAILWEAALTVAHNHDGQLPSINEGLEVLVGTAARKIADARPLAMSPEQQDDLFRPTDGLLLWCTKIAPDTDINVQEAMKLLHQFLVERDAYRAFKRDIDSLNGDVPTELPKILQQYADRVRRVSLIHRDPVESAAPVNDADEQIQKFSTGVTFLDKFMAGGQAAGEVYGILGPTGVGKTLLATQVCVESAIKELTAEKTAQDKGEPCEVRHWYYFTYEAPTREVRRRMMAHLSNIPVNRLENHMSVDLLSDKREEGYIIKSYKGSLDTKEQRSERERFKGAFKQLEKNCWVLGMDGSNPKDPHRGEGYVEELQTILQGEIDKGRKIGGIVVDYAGEACKRYMVAQGIKFDQLRHYIGMFAKQCLRLICEPFRCSAWIVHQMNTEANRRGAGSIPHHSYAAEAGNFAENMWFCFCLGTKDAKNSACLINCSKSRRAPAMDPIPVIIEGEFNRMIEAESRLVLDAGAHKIVAAHDYNTVHDSHHRVGPSKGGQRSGYLVDPNQSTYSSNKHIDTNI